MSDSSAPHRRVGAHRAIGQIAFVGLTGLGGAFGASARWGVGLWLNGATDSFPWGTLAVNLSGSFLLGLLVAYIAFKDAPSFVQPLFATGLLGGYTTFSTLAVEFWELLDAGAFALATGYLVSTVVLGLVAVWLGHRIVEAIYEPRRKLT